MLCLFTFGCIVMCVCGVCAYGCIYFRGGIKLIGQKMEGKLMVDGACRGVNSVKCIMSSSILSSLCGRGPVFRRGIFTAVQWIEVQCGMSHNSLACVLFVVYCRGFTATGGGFQNIYIYI